jgi:ribosomal protein S19
MKRPVSHKGRSVWKGNLFFFNRKQNITNISRNYVISKVDIGQQFYVYNGHIYMPLLIERKYIGCKCGQFCFTKKIGYKIHLTEKKKKRKK